MEQTHFTFELGTRVDVNTGLKATALTSILNVVGVSGVLLAIYCTDPDNLTQNERIQIDIDGRTVLDDPAYDIPNTDDFIKLLASIAKQAVLSGTGIPTDPGSFLDALIGIPFNNRLEVEYSRAVAGTTGLTINIVYAVRMDDIHAG